MRETRAADRAVEGDGRERREVPVTEYLGRSREASSGHRRERRRAGVVYDTGGMADVLAGPRKGHNSVLEGMRDDDEQVSAKEA